MHRYFVQDLDPKSGIWGKQTPVKGVTTILGDTLEKKGLMTWPMGLALGELFGFYDFTTDDGQKLVGFSKDKGTLWGKNMYFAEQPNILPLVQSAAKAWTRKQQAGADVGSFVHDAIQHYVEEHPFEFTIEHYTGEELLTPDRVTEFASATKAYAEFVAWWARTDVELIAAEELVYSRALNYAGAFDGLLKMGDKLVLADWKTSNASAKANAPQGAYYSYFIQSALYALAWHEMGHELVDDLLIVSCRKDGGFDTVFASDLGLVMEELLDWAGSVVKCYRYMDLTKRALVTHATNNSKEKING